DRRLADADLALGGNVAQGGVEAGRVAGGEQLLGVGGAAAAAELLRDRQVDLEQAVVGAGVAGAAVPGGGGDGGVEAGHRGFGSVVDRTFVLTMWEWAPPGC